MTHPFFSCFFSTFVNIFSRVGELRAQTQRLIDESVCLAAGILATNPLTHSHFLEYVFTHLAFPSSVFPRSSDNKDGATRRLRRPSGVRPARPRPVLAPKAILPPSGHDPDDDP